MYTLNGYLNKDRKKKIKWLFFKHSSLFRISVKSGLKYKKIFKNIFLYFQILFDVLILKKLKIYYFNIFINNRHFKKTINTPYPNITFLLIKEEGYWVNKEYIVQWHKKSKINYDLQQETQGKQL